MGSGYGELVYKCIYFLACFVVENGSVLNALPGGNLRAGISCSSVVTEGNIAIMSGVDGSSTLLAMKTSLLRLIDDFHTGSQIYRQS